MLDRGMIDEPPDEVTEMIVVTLSLCLGPRVVQKGL